MRWSRHTDPSVALPCVKALANLDEESPERLVYPHKVFPLYPPFRGNIEHRADVVFVHGLLGTVFITWRQRDAAKLHCPTGILSCGMSQVFCFNLFD